jgi:hypothetical protein
MATADDNVPDRFPLLDAMLEERVSGDAPFAGTVAVLIQHQVGSIVPMTRALIDLGLDPRSLYWVDIPYSANATVVEHLCRLGIPPENFVPSDYHLDQPFVRSQLRRVARLISVLLDEIGTDRRLLVLDDGAYFLEAASCFTRRPPGLAMVEQTRRGLIKMRTNSAMQRYAELAPLINVAESTPKTTIEAEFLARCICDRLVDSLVARGVQERRPRTLLLGYGAMGSSVASVLVRELGWPRERIHVLDTSETASGQAVADGLPLWDRDDHERRRFGLVVGCTGTTSLSVGDWVHLEDGAILASASSGAAELSREQFIEMADQHERDDVHLDEREALRRRSIHADLEVHVVDRSVVFLNGGFPINFTGAVRSSDPPQIQLTRALMLGGALQAVHASSPGLTPLDSDFCGWVTRRFHELCGT